MTLRAADLRFVLPHPVETATVLRRPHDARVEALRCGLEAAGVRVRRDRSDDHAGSPPDLVVASAQDAGQALRLPARTHLLLGRVPPGLLRRTGRAGVPLLVRPGAAGPETIVPVDPPGALRYYLSRMSSPPALAGRLRNRGFAALSRTPVPVERLLPGSALATVLAEDARPLLVPALVRAAHALGVPSEAQWVLALGRGDDLQRAVFHLLLGGRRRWVVKFARVPGAADSFTRDEEGLALVGSAGGTTAAHAPTHLGRLHVAGHVGSVESAAPGRPLLELLGSAPLPLVERIAAWVLQMGTATAAPAAALQPERQRLEREVLPAWRPLGVPDDLVAALPDLPAVLQHNDLGTWNVMTDGHAFMAVDWESARSAGMPLWDLCYFLADALPRAEGPADPGTYLARTLSLFAGRSPHSPVLFGWVRAAVEALQIPPAAVGPLVTLCWLHHGLSAELRGRALAASAAAPLGHLALLGRHWLADPALGSSWSAWRAA